jgi:hypothetical protein
MIPTQVETADKFASSNDRWTPYYTIVAFLFFLYCMLIYELDLIYNFYFKLVIYLGLPVLAFLVLGLVIFFYNAFKRRWRRLLSLVLAPILAILPIAAFSYFGFDMDWVRYEYRKPGLMRDVERLANSDKQGTVVCWWWGDTGGAGTASSSFALIYDDSDQITLPPASWPEDFKSRVKKAKMLGGDNIGERRCPSESDLSDENSGLTRLGSHFFIFEESFG